ncbi:MAG: TonB-dependent receptor [Bacteroidales bacterium]|nr:TonB-dependent receptor [Bacteroidales bacterium]
MRSLQVLIAVGLLSCWTQLLGQRAGIQLLDARSKEPVAFAHIQLSSSNGDRLQTLITDMDGKAEIQLANPVLFAVSAIGYEAIQDTIKPSEKKKVLLQPLSYTIDEVVVTGQYTPQPVDKSIFRVKVIGAGTISQKASNNLGDLMSGELNIRTSFDGALGSRITLQGLGGEHIKFLVDGVPLIGRMNGNIDLGQLNLHHVKQIEVIEGPMSVIYGSNALAGVINIITRDYDQTRYTAQATSYLESVGVYNFTAGLSASKGRWSGTAGAMRNFFDGYSLFDTIRSKQWKPKRQYSGEAGLAYRTPSLHMRMNLSYFNEMLKDNGNLLKPYFETAFDSDFITNRLTSRIDLTSRLRNNRYLTALASYSYYNRVKNTWFVDLTTLDKNLTANVFDQDTSYFGQYLVRAEYSKSASDQPFNYQMGLDLTYETGYGRRILDQWQAIGDYAGFLSVKWQPGSRFLLQPGLRYGFNTRYQAPLVYSLNLKYELFESMSIRGSYAKGFRAPSLKELYLEFVDVNHNIRGNEDLQAESSQNINMALVYQLYKQTHDLSIELNTFYNAITNSITLAAIDPETALYTYVNLDQMITQGYQLQWTAKLFPWIELKTGIGQTGRKQSQQDAPEVDMVYSTDVLATVNYRWQKPKIQVGLFYKYNGKYPEVFVDQDGTILRYMMQPYHIMDVSVSRSFYGNRLQLQAGAKNLFDNTNILISGDRGGGTAHSVSEGSSPVGWGRTYFVKLTFNLYQTK